MSIMECSHFVAAHYDIPNINLVISKENKSCTECGVKSPHLYYCLFKGCHTTGCVDVATNHILPHVTDYPAHCLYENLTTGQVVCVKCRHDVGMEPACRGRCGSEVESDLEEEDVQHANQKDSGHGSFSTLPRHTPERNHVIRNVDWIMSGDTSDTSDDENEVTINRKLVGLVGLQNIGNTCYMNAALQALSNTYPLRHFFLECAATVQILSEDRKPGLSRQYQQLIRDMWIKKNGGYVTPSGILYGIRNVHAMFRGYHQHDTQEFLRNFMDQLHEELKQISPPESTINDVENLCMSVDEPALSSSYDSSEGEYETCDSGVSERSSLSDDTDRVSTSTKRRLSRSTSPGRRLRARIHSHSGSVIDTQPSPSNHSISHNKRAVKYRSIISDIFDGKLLSSVQCLTCDRVSSRVETFQDLSLPIPSRDHLVVLHGRSAAPGATCSDAVLPVQDGWLFWIFTWLKSWFYGPTVTLHDCLAAFFSTDELKGDNMYSCERCNKLRNGLKYSKVLQLPEVLCIHLKRFRHELMFSSKISAVVSFPLKGLDMRPYLHKDCVSEVNNYELFSVICHHGTAGGGHYTCYALNGGGWYEFDDQCVTRVHPDTVANCEAYVLFYRKVLTESNTARAKASELALLAKDTPEVIYVSKQWLSRFSTCAEPGPIDNSDFLCSHNCVQPKRALALDKLAVPIARTVYDYLLKKFGGSQVTSTIHVCATCQALYSRIAAESERLAQLNNEFEYQNEPPTHLLSNTWYTQWKSFVEGKIFEPPPPIDNTRPSISQGGMDDYIEINKEIWDFFFGLYSGGPELLIPRTEGHIMPILSTSPICEEERPDLCDEMGRGEPMDTEESNDSRDTDSREDLVPLSQATTNHSTNSSSSMLNVPTPDDEDDIGNGQMSTEVPNSSTSPMITNFMGTAIQPTVNAVVTNNKRNLSVRQRRKNELMM